jgi:iron(III) transport system ATP-binding protein
MESTPISIQHVGLAFGSHPVLEDISLDIESGEFFAFLGPSGSGKSTLLRLIAGFGPSPSGRVLIGNDDVTHLPPWKRNVGMVFQNYALWPHMTVRRNVAFGLEERKLPAKTIRERVNAALELVGLLNLAERRPAQLSGGQQQRVAIARTIVVEPRVLLLDEPLSNLDANLRVRMRRDIRELQRRLGITTIFVTHDQEEANTIADRMAVLNDGVLQQVGSPMDLYDQPANRFVADFLGTANLIDGEVRNEGQRCIFRSREGLGLALDFNMDDLPSATVMFRPQSLRIHGIGEGNCPGATPLAGEIEHHEFLGGLIRYSVRVDGQSIVVDDEHQRGRRSFGIGDNVELWLDTSQVRVLTA